MNDSFKLENSKKERKRALMKRKSSIREMSKDQQINDSNCLIILFLYVIC